MRRVLKIYYHHLMPKNFLTKLACVLANSKITWLKNYLISDFLKKHAVNMLEAEEPNPLAYASFNDFFTRKLAPGARTIDKKARYVCPVDGVISQAGQIKKDKLLQAKGIDYSLQDLLKSKESEHQTYLDGSFVTIYLSPKDYHRVHMPADGELIKQTYIPGKLYSVQPFTTQNIPNIFSENERLVLHFRTESGPMAMILVGATIVGCIGTAWQGDIERTNTIQTQTFDQPITLNKGDEVGYFKLGSTVIILLPEQAHPQWIKSLKEGTPSLLGESLAN